LKVIQSFWSANQNIESSNFGWYSPKFHVISWALSCIQLSKFYDVELYTDQNGYDFFIDKLKLPYKKVHVVLDDLNGFHKDFWALPKIKSYLMQENPFLHIDGDVYIWKPFPEELLKRGIISQNLEETTSYYKNMWNEIFPSLNFIPAEIKNYASNNNSHACNMGIFGGNDINFLKKYALKSFEFATKNNTLPDKIYGGNFNIFFEQVLLFEMLQIEGKRSYFLLEDIYLDNEYTGFGNFEDIPEKKNYLHLIGPYKRSFQVCKIMETYFIFNYPDFFKKIIDFFPDEYDFFTRKGDYHFTYSENINRKQEFIENIKKKTNSKLLDDDYLFNRDLACLIQCSFLMNNIQNNINFFIQKLNGTLIEEKNLKIKEIKNKETLISIDDIDVVIFEKIENGTFYHTLQKEMYDMLDEDSIESKTQLKSIINDFLTFYLKNRAIIIY